MRIQRPGIVLALLLVPAAASADDHRADRFYAYSRAGGSSLDGFHLTDAFTLPKPPGAKKDFGFLADLSVHFGSPEDNKARSDHNVTRVSVLGGVRWTFANDEAPSPAQRPKLLPFVHALLGGVYTNDGADGGTTPAVGVGAGLDVMRRDGVLAGWGTRVQLDYIAKGSENFYRFSIGVVYRVE